MEEMSKVIKNLFREKINFVIILLIAILALNVYQFACETDNYSKIKKKIDHRYFNVTRSLEQINNIEIDTYRGNIKQSKH